MFIKGLLSLIPVFYLLFLGYAPVFADSYITWHGSYSG